MSSEQCLLLVETRNDWFNESDTCGSPNREVPRKRKAEWLSLNKLLNIGIDARVLAHPHCGIGRYATSLVREFALQQSPHRVFLYSHQSFQLDFSLPEHWKVRAGAVQRNGLSTAFAQMFYPIWALRDAIDVFWSPLSQLPVFLPPRVRKVLTVHDMAWKRFPETMTRGTLIKERLLMPLALRMADRVIADSQFTRSEVLTFFPNAKGKIDVIYLASSLRNKEAIGPSPIYSPYFLFVGSNEPRKNLERMLLAYVQYRKLSTHPSDLVIAGSDQWGEFSLSDFIRTRDLQTCVHLIQHVDDDVLSALYAHAQALVLVSLYEGFGLPLVEAMQWGTPLIASNTSSVAEVARDAALLVDPRDTDAIAQAFEQITDSEPLRQDLSRRAEERGRQFSWKKAASEAMALFVYDRASMR
jgi:glycosyltransferase involved in cell wall biosynthesis